CVLFDVLLEQRELLLVQTLDIVDHALYQVRAAGLVVRLQISRHHLAPGQTGQQETETDADEYRRDRVAADQVRQVLGHAAQALLLKVTAATVQGAGHAGGGATKDAT